ncbi:helix-turn-helix domain-containing protein [Pseudomonas syringae group genomosp. 3]|uniref:Transcriptional regulator n=1 Tax=Pseudomonas syringae pv. persicae TaxID=237306 RepID=A0AB38EID3_9PSED|nr:helix-turn-helix domain-containing protein [Pseudomonas syringae group genomosp. 3]SOQ10365.1 transcriptional regulator [Pseudomonas syringae pv. persicae]SOQ11873.1 transcriptional regulator [Pseudomonas syringae pv. persicae]
MSVQSMSWALEQSDILDATARHVLLCLANYADKNGKAAFPSASSLSTDTGLSIRTVRYKLDYLLDIGAIRLGNQIIAAAYIDRHDRRPVVYDLCIERGASPAPGSPRGANEDTTGCSSEHNGVQLTTERGAPAAPNPSSNHPLTINEPKELVAAAPAKSGKFDPLTAKPENVSDKAWADWCQHRKEIRKPLTAKSCEQQAKSLEGHSNPDDVLTTSIANGWTGIFPDKAASNVHQFPQSRHTGFDTRDYKAGLTPRGDGTYDF